MVLSQAFAAHVAKQKLVRVAEVDMAEGVLLRAILLMQRLSLRLLGAIKAGIVRAQAALTRVLILINHNRDFDGCILFG